MSLYSYVFFKTSLLKKIICSWICRISARRALQYLPRGQKRLKKGFEIDKENQDELLKITFH